MKLLQVLLLVILPIVWGLAVEFIFERLRRRRNKPPEPTPHDWVI